MSDYISRADAIEAVHEYFKGRMRKSKCDYDDELQVYVVGKEERTMLTYNKGINDKLRSLPSADAKQGEWIEKYNGNGWNDFWDYTCSNCGKKYERADAVLYHANYCPNCGARMKGGDNE